MLKYTYMLYENRFKNITWIDLENPTLDEVRYVTESRDIDPLVADELLSPTLRSRVDMYHEYIYMILHFPAANSHKGGMRDTKDLEEIDFVLGKDFIITTRYNTLDALHEFSRVFEVNSILDKSNMGEHAGFVFYYMIQYFYKGMMDKIENVKSLLVDIEEQIFSGNEKRMVYELSKINRLLLTFKEAIALHEEVLQSFEVAGRQFYGNNFSYHLRKVIGEYYRVRSALSSTTNYLQELRSTNDSLLTTKQNEIMKTLTIIAFIVLPLSLVAGIFGMNTQNMPLIGEPNGFWTILVLMLGLALIMYLIVRAKRWL